MHYNPLAEVEMAMEVTASLASLRDALATICTENCSDDNLSYAVRPENNNDNLSPDCLRTESELLKVENELLRSRLRVNLSRQNHGQPSSTNDHYAFPCGEVALFHIGQLSSVSEKRNSVLEKLKSNSQVTTGCLQQLREFLQQTDNFREILRHQSSTISSLEAKTLMFQEHYNSIKLNRNEVQLHCMNGPQKQLYNEKQQELDNMRTSCLVTRDLFDRSQTALRDLQQICKLQSELLESFERR
jgi:hypothetical protein